jgi:hypothetical protein
MTTADAPFVTSCAAFLANAVESPERSSKLNTNAVVVVLSNLLAPVKGTGKRNKNLSAFILQQETPRCLLRWLTFLCPMWSS